jgi:hypothetical protein
MSTLQIVETLAPPTTKPGLRQLLNEEFRRIVITIIAPSCAMC